MENGKKIYELVRLMNDRQGVESDILNSASSLRNSLEKRYISKLHSIVDGEREKVMRSPSREIMLIRALKGFMPSQRHEAMDGMINMLTVMEVLHNMDSSFNSSENTIYNMSAEGEKPFPEIDTAYAKLLFTLAAIGII